MTSIIIRDFWPHFTLLYQNFLLVFAFPLDVGRHKRTTLIAINLNTIPYVQSHKVSNQNLCNMLDSFATISLKRIKNFLIQHLINLEARTYENEENTHKKDYSSNFPDRQIFAILLNIFKFSYFVKKIISLSTSEFSSLIYMLRRK